MVRQLAYDFRPWRYLDASGRPGRDGGLDIHGIEAVSSGLSEPESGAEGDEADNDDRLAITEEREWRIQCKRYKRIGPKLIKENVEELLDETADPPYGLVVAAACDMSSKTLSAFRQEAFAHGVKEAHAWAKAHIEDMLFRPNQDHLTVRLIRNFAWCSAAFATAGDS